MSRPTTGGALLRGSLGALRYRLTGRRMPLAVTLMVTRRCDALCADCAVPLTRVRELDTAGWVGIIDELATLGTVRIGFTGGEPLVRPDIALLVERANRHGIWTTLETNGHAWLERADNLVGLGRLMVGIDGPAPVHDRMREPGSHALATAAVRDAVARGLEVGTISTLTRENVGSVEWIVSHAEETGVKAAFQVLQSDGPLASGCVENLAPTAPETRRALLEVLEARIAGRPVGVSERVLRYLLTWADYRLSATPMPHEDVHCVAGQLHCAIDADGTVLHCPMFSGRGTGPKAGDNFSAAFAALGDPNCRACTSTPLTEYNYLYNLDASALYERLLRSRLGSQGAA